MNRPQNIPKVIELHAIEGYLVSCFFNTNESRIIDFKDFFVTRKNFTAVHPAYKLLHNYSAFQQIDIIENSIGWKNTGITAKNITGDDVFYAYEIDPIVLYDFSEAAYQINIDGVWRLIAISSFVKQEREAIGLTQKELAARSCINESTIYRIENKKSATKIATLKKILEKGFEKKLDIRLL